MIKPVKSDAATSRTTFRELPLLADHKELLRLRIRPAEFARLMGVSKQCVSNWVRDGKIAPPNHLDGRIDVQRSINDVLRNTSPGRLRSRVLKQAVSDALELRENLARAEDRAEIAEAALLDAKEALEGLERWIADGDAHEVAFRSLLIEHATTLRAAPIEAWAQTLDDLSDAAWDVVDTANGIGPDDLADLLQESLPPRAANETEGVRGDADEDQY